MQTDAPGNLAFAPDGKIIVCGTSALNMYVARFETDGDLDSTFDGDGNTDGIVYADFGGSDCAYGVLIQHDGKLVVCGRGGAVPNYKILRYEDDGATDSAFGTNGVTEVDFGGWDIAFGVAVQLQSDGKLILAGSGFGIARFMADGDPDTGFGNNGVMAVNFTGTPQAYAVAVQSDGGIVAVGKRTATYTEFAVARVMGGPVLEERLFAIHDANYNVTGIVDASDGDVVERYVETPYGTVTVLNGADDADGAVQEWSADPQYASDWNWDRVHQGLATDVETGLVYNRARYLQTSLGRFTARDFIGYGDGMNVYLYARSRPSWSFDPSGLGADVEKLKEVASQLERMEMYMQRLATIKASNVEKWDCCTEARYSLVMLTLVRRKIEINEGIREKFGDKMEKVRSVLEKSRDSEGWQTVQKWGEVLNYAGMEGLLAEFAEANDPFDKMKAALTAIQGVALLTKGDSVSDLMGVAKLLDATATIVPIPGVNDLIQFYADAAGAIAGKLAEFREGHAAAMQNLDGWESAGLPPNPEKILGYEWARVELQKYGKGDLQAQSYLRYEARECRGVAR